MTPLQMSTLIAPIAGIGNNNSVDSTNNGEIWPIDVSILPNHKPWLILQVADGIPSNPSSGKPAGLPKINSGTCNALTNMGITSHLISLDSLKVNFTS